MEKYEDLEEELRLARIQEERTSALLEVANREKKYLWERINQYECKQRELNEQVSRQDEEIEKAVRNKVDLEKKNKDLEIENSDLETRNKNMETRNNDLETMNRDMENQICSLQIAVNEYERYKRSISYKIMQPVRKLWDALHFWRKH